MRYGGREREIERGKGREGGREGRAGRERDTRETERYREREREIQRERDTERERERTWASGNSSPKPDGKESVYERERVTVSE